MRRLALAVAAALAVLPAAAVAKKPDKRPRGKDRVSAVVRDCAHHGRLTHRYKVATLRRTLRHLPADIADYTSCDDVISREIKRRR